MNIKLSTVASNFYGLSLQKDKMKLGFFPMSKLCYVRGGVQLSKSGEIGSVLINLLKVIKKPWGNKAILYELIEVVKWLVPDINPTLLENTIKASKYSVIQELEDHHAKN